MLVVIKVVLQVEMGDAGSRDHVARRAGGGEGRGKMKCGGKGSPPKRIDCVVPTTPRRGFADERAGWGLYLPIDCRWQAGAGAGVSEPPCEQPA